MTDLWENILQEYRAKNYLVLTRDNLEQISLENLLANIPASQSTQALLRQLSNSRVSLWNAFIYGIQCAHENLQENDLFTPLKTLFEHVTRLTVLHGEDVAWKSPDQWSYLVEIVGLWGRRTPGYFLLHPPALREHVQQAETVLGVPLPPSFVRFLTCTNGLGFYARELEYIGGAGIARAFWPLLTQWGRPSYHEVASDWWQWQDMYAYERQRDQEEGIIADHLDEQIAIPFARTADAWCFDRSKPDEMGEYPVFYWDHELCNRETDVEYPSFEAWFLDGVIGGKLFEDDPEAELMGF
jgi:SMI1-KNR4 cell-wall